MDQQTLKQKTFSGFIWKFLERICAQGISLVVSIVLARVLMPEDYSAISIVTIFFAFCNVIISGGLNTALIQKKNTDIIDYSTILYVSLALAVLMYGAMFFAAPFIASLYDKPILIPVMRVMGISFFIYAYKAVLCAHVSHSMAFRKFFWATIIGTAVSAVIGLYMAYNGAGPWALVAQQMTKSIIDTIVLSFTTRFRPKLVFSFARLRELWGFGWKMFVASFITTIYNEAKPLIVGIKYTTVDLAYYNKGHNFPSLLNTTISNTMSGVLLPAMSKLQDNKQALLNATRRYMKVSSFLVFPMMFGLLGVADSFVRVVLTEKWMMCVPYIQIFCIVYAFDFIHLGNLQAIQAMGRSDITLILEIIKKSLYLVAIVLFLVFSRSATVFAYSNIACSILGTIINTYPNRKLLGYSYSLQIKDIALNMICAVFMGVVVNMMNSIPIHATALLLLQILCGAALYFVLAVIFRNENLRYVLDLVRKLTKKKRGATEE